MTKDDIIRIARETGLLVIGTADGSDAVYTWPQGITEELERFANLVAAAEREACAKVCENWTRTPETTGMELTLAAAAIRSRGEE